MTFRSRLLAVWMRKRPKSISATKNIAIAFALIILTGGLLLTLPISSRSGVSCGFRPALFTATSATCVTGLVLFDTWTQWTGFGQGVILGLIEIGGLGFMSAATLVIFFLHKRIGLKQRLVMAQAMSLNDLNGVVRIIATQKAGSELTAADTRKEPAPFPLLLFAAPFIPKTIPKIVTISRLVPASRRVHPIRLPMSSRIC